MYVCTPEVQVQGGTDDTRDIFYSAFHGTVFCYLVRTTVPSGSVRFYRVAPHRTVLFMIIAATQRNATQRNATQRTVRF